MIAKHFGSEQGFIECLDAYYSRQHSDGDDVNSADEYLADLYHTDSRTGNDKKKRKSYKSKL